MTSTVVVFHIATPARLGARFESVHEVALSTQLARLVSKAAEGRRVLTVRLEIGALRGGPCDRETRVGIRVRLLRCLHNRGHR